MPSTKRKCTLYTRQIKLQVINFAKENNNKAAEVQFSVSEEDLEEASGRGDRESWFEEGGCSETR